MKLLQLLIALAVVAMTSVSCDTLNELTVFDFDQNFNFVLNETEPDEDISFTRKLSVDLNQELEDRKLGAVEIEDVRPKSAVITLSVPDGSTFSIKNITSGVIEISTIGGTGKSIATFSKADVDSATGNSVDMNVSDIDLLPFLEADEFSYTATFEIDATAPQDAKVEIALTHEVDTKLK